MSDDAKRREGAEPCPALWRTIVEHLPFDGFVLGTNGRYLAQTTASRQRWGEVVGQRPEEYCREPEALAVWQENNRRALAGEQIDAIARYRLQGQERCFRNILVPLRRAEQVEAVLIVNLEITEQLRAEEALKRAHEELDQRVQQRTAELEAANQQLRREIEERRRAEQACASFGKFAEAAGQGFALSGLDGLLTYVNPKICEWMGYRAEEMRGRPYYTFYPEDFQEQLRQQVVEAVRAQGTWTGDAPLVTRSGAILSVLQSLFLLCDESGQPVQVANILTDISERKAAEEALRQSHAELQAIYEGMLDGLAVIDCDSMRFLVANISLQQMLSYSEAELLGMVITDIHPPEDRERVQASFRNRTQVHLSSPVSRRAVRKDGSEFFVDIRTSRIVYDGRPAMIGLFRDVSERIAADQALQQERHVLRNLLAAGDRERQLISYEIHDGLTQQLTGALMQFQTCAAFYSRDLPQAVKAYQRGMSLLQASLAEARRLISGVRPPLLDDAGVVPAIENLVQETNHHDGPRVELVTALELGRLQPVLENAIFRIIQECLTNACRHSRSDRVMIELRQSPETIEIRVQDWGVGLVAAEVREDCFGLEGIRERARLLGGQVRLDSQPGQGTCVRVRLPLLPRAAEEF